MFLKIISSGTKKIRTLNLIDLVSPDKNSPVAVLQINLERVGTTISASGISQVKVQVSPAHCVTSSVDKVKSSATFPHVVSEQAIVAAASTTSKAPFGRQAMADCPFRQVYYFWWVFLSTHFFGDNFFVKIYLSKTFSSNSKPPFKPEITLVVLTPPQSS
jgi:hypothetical protein